MDRLTQRAGGGKGDIFSTHCRHAQLANPAWSPAKSEVDFEYNDDGHLLRWLRICDGCHCSGRKPDWLVQSAHARIEWGGERCACGARPPLVPDCRRVAAPSIA